jgi:hypothetical protein
MPNPFQFRLRTLLLAFVPAAIIALRAGNYLRQPKPIPVDGTVTLDGLPINDAKVSFFPADKYGREAKGVTDMAGRFELLTMLDDGNVIDKAYPGSYRVTVEKIRSYLVMLDRRTVIPHTDVAPYELMVEVTRGGPNDFAFHLTTVPED